MFKDTPDGTTHSFEDSCQPPHEKQENDFEYEPYKKYIAELRHQHEVTGSSFCIGCGVTEFALTDLLQRHEAHVRGRVEREDEEFEEELRESFKNPDNFTTAKDCKHGGCGHCCELSHS